MVENWARRRRLLVASGAAGLLLTVGIATPGRFGLGWQWSLLPVVETGNVPAAGLCFGGLLIAQGLGTRLSGDRAPTRGRLGQVRSVERALCWLASCCFALPAISLVLFVLVLGLAALVGPASGLPLSVGVVPLVALGPILATAGAYLLAGAGVLAGARAVTVVRRGDAPP